jgi:hypothetical protein
MSRRYPVCNAKEVIKVLRKTALSASPNLAAIKNGGTKMDGR